MIFNEKIFLKRVFINYLLIEYMFGKSFLRKGIIYYLLVVINIGYLFTYFKDSIEMNEEKKYIYIERNMFFCIRKFILYCKFIEL